MTLQKALQDYINLWGVSDLLDTLLTVLYANTRDSRKITTPIGSVSIDFTDCTPYCLRCGDPVGTFCADCADLNVITATEREKPTAEATQDEEPQQARVYCPRCAYGLEVTW